MRDANAENTSFTDIQLFDGNWTAVAQDPFFVQFVPPLPQVDDADAHGEDVDQPAQPATIARAEYSTPSGTNRSPSENSGKCASCQPVLL